MATVAVAGTTHPQVPFFDSNISLFSLLHADSHVSFGYRGIHNLGTTCYMNAVMQQLFHVASFSSTLMNAVWIGSDASSPDAQLFFSLQAFFREVGRHTSVPFNPTDWISHFTKPDGEPLRLGVQEDAHEYLNMLLNKCDAILKNTDHPTLVQNEFLSKVNVSVTCPHCGIISKREEEYTCLSVDVKGFTSLSDSLNALCSPERIDDYHCDKCGLSVSVEKTQVLETTSPYLFFQLKRFAFDNFTYERYKINDFFSFPLELDLSTCFADIRGKETRYDLKGIITHLGTIDSGHYISYICSSKDEWWEMNDTVVCRVDSRELLTRARGSGSVGGVGSTHAQNDCAYILLYKQRIIDEVTPQEEEEKSSVALSPILGSADLWRMLGTVVGTLPHLVPTDPVSPLSISLEIIRSFRTSNILFADV